MTHLDELVEELEQILVAMEGNAMSDALIRLDGLLHAMGHGSSELQLPQELIAEAAAESRALRGHEVERSIRHPQSGNAVIPLRLKRASGASFIPAPPLAAASF